MNATLLGAVGSHGVKHRRIVVTRPGGPEVLQVVQEDQPAPRAGEVRVRVLAAGVSAYDLMFRRAGWLPGRPRVPFTLGADVVGVVDQVCEAVSAFHAGQMVAGATFAQGGLGGYAECLCLPADALVNVPAGVDPADAVCLVSNYLTAHMALHRVAAVQRGERVLVHGAAGGVGTALLQLGRLAGVELYGTASRYNHPIVSALGATLIDYHTEDFVERIRHLTGAGVAAVFDPSGGFHQLWRSRQALRPGGRLVWFGVAATKVSGLRVIPLTLLMVALLKLMPGGKRVLPFPALGQDKAWYRQTLGELLTLLAAGQLKPVVAARIPLTEAARAHALLERGGYAGKVVLVTRG
jgi:NADPH2:quinone reductase